MLALSPGTKVYLAAGSTDLRRSIDGLAPFGTWNKITPPRSF
jgi:hypothetical protein